MLNSFKTILRRFLAVLLFLLLAAIIFINTDYGQNFIAREVASRLSRSLETRIQLQHVSFSLFNKMNLEGLLIEDRKKDTLLYAGLAQVRITDWFFFRDKAVLKYVGVENAVLHMNRTDSVWNYQFILDYFAGGGGKKKSGGVTLDLKELDLKNFYILKRDEWRGENMLARFASLELDANIIEISQKKIDINSIDIRQPLFHLTNYTGRRPASLKQEILEEAGLDSSLAWNTDDWDLRVGSLVINDGIFRNEKRQSSLPLPYFDGNHIEFTAINASFNNLRFVQDTIKTSLELNAKERSGLIVKSMEANLVFHPQAMEFRELDLQTNRSHIRDYFAMRFRDFEDMSDFISKVRMEASFNQTTIDSEDIAFFAPDAGNWNKRIRVSGNVRGSVDDLFGNNMIIEAGQNTVLRGDISLIGLPDINRTFIDFRADDFRTTYGDAVTFVPAIRRIRNPQLQNIRYLHFTGSFTGFIRDFVTFGTIRTNLGTITSDINMKLPYGRLPIYSGTISSRSFNLGNFINNTEIGTVSFEGRINGTGFTWNTLAVNIDGRISEFIFNNYRYRNVTAKGSLKQRQFNGTAIVNDSNAIFRLDGLVDLSGNIPRFDFIADVDRLNLRPLGFSKEDYSFQGQLDFDFASNNIDNFLGDARIDNAILTRSGKRIPIDSLVVSSGYYNGRKEFRAVSNEFEARINGTFSLIDIPDAFKLFLNKYYPTYIKAPSRQVSIAAFDFDIRTRYVDDYIRLIDSSLRGFDNSTLTGSLSLANNQMELKAIFPSIGYDNVEFQNLQIESRGDLEKLSVNATLDNIRINDSLSITKTNINILARDDLSDITIKTSSDNRNIPAGNIQAQVRSYNDGFDVKFDSSNFVMNGKTWTINKDGELEFQVNQTTNNLNLVSGNLSITESNQEIRLFTEASDIGYGNDLVVELENLNLGDITPLVIKTNRIEGLATGTIRIEDPNNRFNVSGEIRTEHLRIDDDSIGQARLNLAYNDRTGELKINGQNLNPDERIAVDVNLFLKDKDNLQEDQISITSGNFPVNVAERFIGTLFSDLDGYATGELKIIGEGNNRKFIGKMRLRDAGLKVKFTQCYYKILDTEIEFREDALDLGRIKLLDTITGNTATLSRGIIRHQNWRNMSYDIRVATDNQPLQLLNTGPRDNESFYGRARGTGSFSLTGPERDMRIRVIAAASSVDSSYITIPSTDSREGGIADFLVERKYGRELTDSAFQNETNIYYDVSVTANNFVNVRVVLDEQTGDEIRGYGEGTLRITSGSDEPLSLRGRYNIEEGSYLFTFQSFFKKPFELSRDAGNYIEWNGDPYQPYVKIDAIYKTEKKVSFSSLLNAGITGSNTVGIREYVYVIAKLRGDLFAPRITFDLAFPPDSPPETDQSVAFLINQVRANEYELNKQVAFLVVFNSFAPSEAGSSLSLYSGVDIVVNSISGFLSSQINNALNNFLSKQLKIPGLYVDFSGSLYNPNPFGESETGFGYDRSNLNVTLAKAFFNDRFIITFEGNLDVPLQTSSPTTQLRSDFLKNVTTEWLINKSGTIRATFFYRENVDFLTGTTSTGNSKSRKYGVSLAYRRDYNSFWDIFRGKKARKKQEPEAEAKEEEDTTRARQ